MTLQKNKDKRSRSRRCFLVASPYASQTPYGRSVVLLIRNDSNGATGILLDSEFRQSFHRLAGAENKPEKKPESKLESSGTNRLQSEMQLSILNWTPEELVEELAMGIWLTTPARREDLARKDDLWVELVRRVGRSILHDTLKIGEFPADPSIN